MSNAKDDLPLPLKPVITTSLSRGISTVIFFKLCCLAPLTINLSCIMHNLISNLFVFKQRFENVVTPNSRKYCNEQTCLSVASCLRSNIFILKGTLNIFMLHKTINCFCYFFFLGTNFCPNFPFTIIKRSRNSAAASKSSAFAASCIRRSNSLAILLSSLVDFFFRAFSA